MGRDIDGKAFDSIYLPRRLVAKSPSIRIIVAICNQNVTVQGSQLSDNIQPPSSDYELSEPSELSELTEMSFVGWRSGICI